MKISYFITHFPYKNWLDSAEHFYRYQYGGAELAAYYLASEMAKLNEVNVFTTSINSKNSFENYDGISVHRYGTIFRIEKGNISPGLFTRSLSYDTDVVHAHFSTPPAEMAALRYAKKKKLPFIITYHGDWQESFGGFIRRAVLSFYNKHLIEKVLSSADVIVSPSEHYISESRFLGKYKHKTITISNGVNLNDFNIKHSKEECRKKLGLEMDKNIILFLGNLAPYKGTDVLVKALPIVMNRFPDTELIFVGDGRMKKELKELSRRLDVRKHIKFAGFVFDLYYKALYYKAADIFVLPSTKEVFPLVLLEASAAGLPIIVSDLKTFRCIIEDGWNGLFTKRGDYKSLADAIIYLLENEDVKIAMGENAKEKAKALTWGKVAEKYEKLYELVI